MLAFERFGAFTGSTTCYQGNSATLEDMQATMKLVEKIMDKNPCIIQIWRGKGCFKARRTDPKKLRPQIHLSEYVSDSTLFIAAGIGIVAGAKAYEIIKRMGIILQWSDEHAPLEDQSSEAAKILLKWEVKGKKNGYEGSS